MNSRAKGRRNENKVRDWLISAGWEVEQVKGSTKFNKSVDFFNRWDLIAVREDQILWVQIKTNKLPPPSYREYLSSFRAPGKKQLWIVYDRQKDFRIIDL